MDIQLARQLFVVFLTAGILLFCIEIFVPGGVLGAFAGAAMLAAVVMGFVAFPGYGGWIAIGIVFLLGAAIAVWIRIFPKTRVGKQMTISQDLSSSKSAEPLNELIGKSGRAITPLRPAGYAEIDGRRVDVITEGEMISKDEQVRVMRIEGSRVIVTKAEQ